MAISGSLLTEWVEFGCPHCAYPVEVEIADVVAQTYSWCPACRSTIKLVDSDGSLFASLRQVDDEINALMDSIRRAFS